MSDQTQVSKSVIPTDVLDAVDRALTSAVTTAVTLGPLLTEPFADDPRWTPDTRFLAPMGKRAMQARTMLRKARAEPDETPPSLSDLREAVFGLDGSQALVCVASAVVVEDDRHHVPYGVSGDLVGRVERIGEMGFYLVGHSFATKVRWDYMRGVWPRADAPNPCPLCGGRDR